MATTSPLTAKLKKRFIAVARNAVEGEMLTSNASAAARDSFKPRPDGTTDALVPRIEHTTNKAASLAFSSVPKAENAALILIMARPIVAMRIITMALRVRTHKLIIGFVICKLFCMLVLSWLYTKLIATYVSRYITLLVVMFVGEYVISFCTS